LRIRHCSKLKKTQFAIVMQMRFLYHVGEIQNLNFMQFAKVIVHVFEYPKTLLQITKNWFRFSVYGLIKTFKINKVFANRPPAVKITKVFSIYHSTWTNIANPIAPIKIAPTTVVSKVLCKPQFASLEIIWIVLYVNPIIDIDILLGANW